MEFDEQNVVEEREGEAVEIYSRRAIWWFSIIPVPLFGGVLLAMNLWAAGYKKAIYPVIAFALAATIGARLLIDKLMIAYKIVIPANYKMTNDALNQKIVLVCLAGLAVYVISATVLSRYFFSKYFPDNDYYPKSVAGPLVVAALMVVLSGFSGI